MLMRTHWARTKGNLEKLPFYPITALGLNFNLNSEEKFSIFGGGFHEECAG
jgi:hypothetical protein